MNRRTTLVAMTALCAGLFGAGLVRLFLWRFGIGDVYPAYSSFRTDPLGTRALHDALGSLPGHTVTRFLQATTELPEGRGACLLLLGASPSLAGSPAELADLDHFLAGGGRVVLALDLRRRASQDRAPAHRGHPDAADADPPAASPDHRPHEGPDEAPARGDAAPPATPPPLAEPRRRSRSRSDECLLEHWGLGVAVVTTHSTPGSEAGEARLAASVGALPATLPWSARGTLDLRAPSWTAVYQAAGHPVVVWRRVGAGTLVVAADSYLFSNEGLRDALQAPFLSWTVGPSPRILIDETHFGIQSRPGVMALARRYRLHGFAAALAALAVLYLWQSLARPLSAPAEGRADATVAGRAAPSALRDLLRHHLPRETLLEHCVEAWRRTAALPAPVLERRLARLRACLRSQQAAPRRRRDIVAGYRELCEIVARKE